MIALRHRSWALPTLVALLLCTSCGPTYFGLRLLRPQGSAAAPTLRWEGAVDCTYDLRIYRESDGGLEYERVGLGRPEHTVATRLPPGAYRWTVRPRRGSGASARVGPWTIEQGDYLPRGWQQPLPMLALTRFTVPR